ncbi:MAG: DUF480 domain-containing protein, partial [Silvibacterium sp.]
VMQLDEITVRQALSRLEELALAGRVHDTRVIKFEHHARQALDLRRPEIAVLCLLLLRGPQTVGELRNRSERLYAFDDISAVQPVLERMARSSTDPDLDTAGKPRAALVTQLPRRPGEKESRYAHLLSGEPAIPAASLEPLLAAVPHPPNHVERLESELAALRAAVNAVFMRLEKLEASGPKRDS